MENRFSTAYVLRDIGRQLPSRWLGLLVVTGVYALIGWAAGQAFVGESSVDLLRQPMLQLANVLSRALLVGAVLHLVFAPDKGDLRVDLMAAARTAVTRWPSVVTTLLLLGALRLIFSFAAGLALNGGGLTAAAASLSTTATTVSIGSIAVGVVELGLFAYFGTAPVTAVAERLAPLAALRRAIDLSSERGLLLCLVYLAGYLAIGAVVILLLVAASVATGHPLLAAPLPPMAATMAASALGETLRVLALAAVYRELRRLNDPVAQTNATVEVFS
jgi:hypothetical protein